MRMGRKIMWRIVSEIYQCVVGKRKLVMIDAPILYETKYLEYICFPIIVVGCPAEVQVQRMVETRGLTEDEARARIASQMPLELKKKKADIYVENNSTPDEMFTNTLKKLNKILATKKK
jgi:dephospho-CoA kinase